MDNSSGPSSPNFSLSSISQFSHLSFSSYPSSPGSPGSPSSPSSSTSSPNPTNSPFDFNFDKSLVMKRKFASGISNKGLNLRKTTHGLNLEGYCKNTSCKAYNQLQIVRHFGYGTYKFPTEPHLSICKLCKKQVEPVTCGFTNTLWKYEWKKSVDLNAWRMEGTTERTITEKSTTWERAELDEYVTFGNASISEDVGVQWLKLKITTVRL